MGATFLIGARSKWASARWELTKLPATHSERLATARQQHTTANTRRSMTGLRLRQVVTETAMMNAANDVATTGPSRWYENEPIRSPFARATKLRDMPQKGHSVPVLRRKTQPAPRSWPARVSSPSWPKSTTTERTSMPMAQAARNRSRARARRIDQRLPAIVENMKIAQPTRSTMPITIPVVARPPPS